MKISDALNEHSKTGFRMLEGPIQWTVMERNFLLHAMGEEDASAWIGARFSTEWRRLVLVNLMKSTILGAVPAIFGPVMEKDVGLKCPYATQRELDQARDKYLGEIAEEYVTITRLLTAKALHLTKPEDIPFIRSIPEKERLKLIAVQDSLNGYDILQHMVHIQNVAETAKTIKDFKDNELEKRAEELALEKFNNLRSSESSAADRNKVVAESNPTGDGQKGIPQAHEPPPRSIPAEPQPKLKTRRKSPR